MFNLVFATLLFIAPVDQQVEVMTLTNETEDIEVGKKADYFLPNFNQTFVDDQKIDQLLEALNKKVFQDPINASLDAQGNIIPEKAGYAIDPYQFNRLYRSYLYNETQQKFEIPKYPVFPRVTSEILADIKEKQVGEFITYFNKSDKERTHNIILATAAINNHVVFPQESFSFNDVVGERTKERNYKKSTVIIKGELAEDYGGGICQVSSTLFNAVSLNGIDILERYSHSRSVPYVPPGKDATVSWWGPDFVFKNNLKQPVLIRATASNGKMAIQIYSSDDGLE